MYHQDQIFSYISKIEKRKNFRIYRAIEIRITMESTHETHDIRITTYKVEYLRSCVRAPYVIV